LRPVRCSIALLFAVSAKSQFIVGPASRLDPFVFRFGMRVSF
jgi:hypothetical protein